MLMAERDKKRIEINICPSGMENRICEVLPLTSAVECKKNILMYIMEPHKPLLNTYNRRIYYFGDNPNTSLHVESF
ncbi:hypothetical protein Nmel_008200 [Mimus melanotis]